jgi:sulfite reductase (ferredoxin)
MTIDATTTSPVEAFKAASDFLRGSIAEELGNDRANVTDETEQLLKFHGIYAGDNRDLRRERAQAKEELDYIFMIRVVVPGGRISAQQWLALDVVADEVADGSLRLTTREAIQFHGVVKNGLRPLARRLDEVWMSSFGGCGDVVRNVVMCPDLQLGDHDHGTLITADALSAAFRPSTSAHWEIFVNGQVAASKESFSEQSFYGDSYLPRKFKIAIAHPNENCVDVFAQDLGLIPATDHEGREGFSMMVGGGFGRSYANPDTFARLADVLAFVTHEEVVETIAAVVATYRDLGNRSNRKRARMKYIIADHGLAAFRAEVEKRLGRSLREPVALPEKFAAHDHLGWRQRTDGTWDLGVRVSAGRVKDDGALRLRTALRTIASSLDVTFYATAQQDLIIAGVSDTERPFVEQLLVSHGVKSVEQLGLVERTALACPALPTCSQALAESERRLPELVDAIEGVLAGAGVRRPLQLRVTGCPNGCARPAVAEVGIVGRTKSTYDVFVGGGPRGDRLARVLKEKVPFAEISATLAPLVERWRDEGIDDEAFGDFVTRAGIA